MMSAQIRKVGIGLLLAFTALFLQLNYIQIWAAEDIASNPNNIRALIAEYSVKRGDIETHDGKLVATSRESKGRYKYERVYPEGDLYAHIVGYKSIVYGETRLEAAFDEQLQGKTAVQSMQDLEDTLSGGEEQGDDLRLTIHHQLQEKARDLLDGRDGAIVALNPQTGEVRAMWSNPSYDPNPLASHDTKEVRRYRLTLDPNSNTSPLISRATSRSFAPGSTFKVVTTAAALESGQYRANSTFPDPVALDLPQTDDTLQNFTRTACTSAGRIDLFTALEVSCDTTYGILGMEIYDQLRETSEAMGFNEAIPFDVGTEASTFPDVGDDNIPFRAFAGIGQGDVSATPLQMALVAATVANGGEVPRPRLVRQVIDPSGGIVEPFTPETIGRAMSQETAARVNEMMQAVVLSGTGTSARIEGVPVAGKTGTAQTVPGESPHAWFIAFAPADDPQLAVAVIVESSSAGSEATGGAIAAPLAKQILETDRAISAAW
ncbi:MAG TPA: penicillin-binding transpeptidase domain-containing protein [Actinomycetota bacterium]|nr:penicillin-binding transpeptidase domain-containing protein [Actinomycetota bacterium]